LTPCSIDKKCSALNATESISINPDFKAFRHQDLIAFIQETNTRKWIVVASLHGQEYTGLISISLLLPDDELWNIARQLINHLKK
jgi:predicted deacylase